MLLLCRFLPELKIRWQHRSIESFVNELLIIFYRLQPHSLYSFRVLGPLIENLSQRVIGVRIEMLLNDTIVNSDISSNLFLKLLDFLR